MKKMLHIIGTGTATVTKYVNTSCVLDDGENLFLTDGTGGAEILKCFETMNLDWHKLHHAFLSHEHTDHFLGMVWVVRNITEFLELNDYEGDFYLYGHAEVLDKMRAVCRMLLKPKSCSYLETRIHFIPVFDHEERKILNYKVTFFDIESKKAKQFGYHLEWPDGMRLVFAGDEPLSPNGEQFCQEADWLLQEAFCLYDEEPLYHAYQYSHQTVREAGEKAERNHVKNLLVWHTEDGTFGYRKELYEKEAKQYYQGRIWVPEDGDVIDLTQTETR